MARKRHAKLLKLKGGDEHWQGAMAGMADPGEYADEILPNGGYSSLFVYMFRRFGIPETGSDPYKEIACWYLTTPDPAVGLMVSPCPSGLRYSFGYWVNTNIYKYHSHDDIVAIRAVIEPFLYPITFLHQAHCTKILLTLFCPFCYPSPICSTPCHYSSRLWCHL